MPEIGPATPVSAAQVQRLRQLTGIPWMECKRLLTSLDPSERLRFLKTTEEYIKWQEANPGKIRHDPIEDDPAIRPLFLAVCEEVSREVQEYHRLQITELEERSPSLIPPPCSLVAVACAIVTGTGYSNYCGSDTGSNGDPRGI